MDVNCIIICFQEVIAFGNFTYFTCNRINHLVRLKVNWNRFYHFCGSVSTFLSMNSVELCLYIKKIQHENQKKRQKPYLQYICNKSSLIQKKSDTPSNIDKFLNFIDYHHSHLNPRVVENITSIWLLILP